MKRLSGFILASTLAVSLVCAPAAMAAKKAKDIKTMSKEDQIKVAMSAAPSFISKDATIMVFGADGKFTEAKAGTNGFTCIPDIDGQEKPDPFCGDKAATQWIMDAIDKKDKPSNTEPGVAYMMQGGWHWEKDGKVVLDREGAKRVKEPPHWMIFWPFDSAKTMLPSLSEKKFKTYIMYDGTPYAHLMIYQDPRDLKGPGR